MTCSIAVPGKGGNWGWRSGQAQGEDQPRLCIRCPPHLLGAPPGWAAPLPNSLTTRHRVFGLTIATQWAESCCSGLSLACRQGAGHVRTLQSAAMQLQSQAAKGKQNAQNLPPPPWVIKISFL